MSLELRQRRPSQRDSRRLGSIKRCQHPIAVAGISSIDTVAVPVTGVDDAGRLKPFTSLKPYRFRATESLPTTLPGPANIEKLSVNVLVFIAQPRVRMDKLFEAAAAQVEYFQTAGHGSRPAKIRFNYEFGRAVPGEIQQFDSLQGGMMNGLQQVLVARLPTRRVLR